MSRHKKNKFVEIITQTANNYDLTHWCIGITISAAGTTLLKITIATVTMMSCHFHWPWNHPLCLPSNAKVAMNNESINCQCNHYSPPSLWIVCRGQPFEIKIWIWSCQHRRHRGRSHYEVWGEEQGNATLGLQWHILYMWWWLRTRTTTQVHITVILKFATDHWCCKAKSKITIPSRVYCLIMTTE